MFSRARRAAEQLRHFRGDARRIVAGRWWRWFTLWTNPSVWTNAMYRWDRGGYLLCGSAWTAIRPLNFPVFFAFRAMGARGDIHYKADVDEGLLVLHPDLGVVVSGAAVIGRNAVLTGGNCLGRRAGATDIPYVIGDDLEIGANASIVGPVTIGDRVTIGAGAVVISDAADDAVLVGVPAKPTSSK